MDLIIEVNQDNPDIITAFANEQILNCNHPAIELLGNSDTDGVSYTWTGPGGFNATTNDVEVDAAGTYTLLIEAPNGCRSTQDINVPEDFETPDLNTNGNLITCETTEVEIQASSTANVSYQWTGPGGYSSDEQSPTVSEAGLYTVVVTSLQNGCTNIADATVDIDQGIPVVNTEGGLIDCNNPMVSLSGAGSSEGSNISYEWIFNGNVISSDLNLMVGTAGTYTLIVSDSENNCTAQSSFEIEEIPPLHLVMQVKIRSCDVQIIL